jgi:hypothetical protein
MNHDTVREKLLDLTYGELSEREAALVEGHLAGCEACRAERDRIAGTRAAMRRLEPVPAPERGERILLAAARQAAERRPGRRPLLAPWIWRVSLTTALVAVVGLVSYRVISLREGQQGEARDEAETERYARAPPGKGAEPVFAAPPPAEVEAPPAPASPSAARKEAAPRRPAPPAIARAPRPMPAPASPAPSAPVRRKAEAAPHEAKAASRAGSVAAAGRPLPAAPERAMGLLAAKPAEEPAGEEAAAPVAAPRMAAGAAPAADAMREAAPVAGRRDLRLRAIRQRVDAVERDRRQGRLTESIRAFERCAPGADAERRLYRDGEGRAAKYVRETGGDDAALIFEQTYDLQGRLRYVFIHGGATNGTVVEHRIYLDESGQRLLEEQRIRRGPGYPFPSVWPEQDLTASQPEADFGAAARCPEIGAGGGR